ncbi:hypothetical protein WOLCODRAFT_19030 [Wolfiporia cocos MD-104 SS10]|uniref:Uncharacterized protein n=1 Tax=Wolfiporia cocos (strain MD-104) TaxID=742152 RepID=A0A2H3JX84_WOLCO|nr:hypothetical protein WOLCODRAFT_19030 [Wolfiporia cocos MD-104 SS10]
MVSPRVKSYHNTRVDIVESTTEDRAARMDARRSTRGDSEQAEAKAFDATATRRGSQRRQTEVSDKAKADASVRAQSERRDREINKTISNVMTSVHTLLSSLKADGERYAREREQYERSAKLSSPEMKAIEKRCARKASIKRDEEQQLVSSTNGNGNNLKVERTSFMREEHKYNYRLVYNPDRELSLSETSEYGSEDEDEDVGYRSRTGGNLHRTVASSKVRGGGRIGSEAVLGDKTNVVRQPRQGSTRSELLSVTAGSTLHGNRTAISRKFNTDLSATSITGLPKSYGKGLAITEPVLSASTTRLALLGTSRRDAAKVSNHDGAREIKSPAGRVSVRTMQEDRVTALTPSRCRATPSRYSVPRSPEYLKGDVPARGPQYGRFGQEASSSYTPRSKARSTCIIATMKHETTTNKDSMRTGQEEGMSKCGLSRALASPYFETLDNKGDRSCTKASFKL